MTRIERPMGPELQESFTSKELRKAFGKFATGVTVVTCQRPDGVPHGATVNAFTAVSLNPPLAQVTLIRGNKACEYLENTPFAINIMANHQIDVCLNFAGVKLQDDIQWRASHGVPILEGNAATLVCRPWRTYEGGDHLIVIGEITSIDINETEPLLFVSGKFRHPGRFVQGTPWEGSGDCHSIGWLEEPNTFAPF
ncbi:MAG TPA: flavin reductase family protein [Enteractinococcus sp.]